MYLNKYKKPLRFNNTFNSEVNLTKHMDNEHRQRKKLVHRDHRTQKLENSFVNDLNITSHGVLVLPKVRELYAGASSTFIAGWSLQGAG